MLTISRLARKFDLSRSTLLYYDRAGLLSPSGRTAANYRVYTGEDEDRLRRICEFRKAGVPVKQIRAILAGEGSDTSSILQQRLAALNEEIADLRAQQRTLLDLLGSTPLRKRSRTMDKKTWIAILRATGMNDADMDQWHRQFESRAPEAHQDFLESLGLAPAHIRRIRQESVSPSP